MTYKYIVSHGHVLKSMQALGYPIEGGACYGLHMMEMLYERKKFYELLKIIGSCSPLELIQKLNKARRKLSFGEKLTLEENNLLEVPALFEGVKLHHKPYSFGHLFKDGWKIKTQADSRFVTELGLYEYPSKVKSFSGIYDESDLVKYFSSFQEIIDKNPPELEKPIYFSLRNLGHAILVTYDSKQKTWAFSNSNGFVEESIYNLHELARVVSKNLMTGENERSKFTAFSSDVYAYKSDCVQVSPIIDNWTLHPEYQEIHEPTQERAWRIDYKDASWLCIAAQNGQASIINELIANKANVNYQAKTAHDLKSLGPVDLAVLEHHVESIQNLLKKGARLNPLLFKNPKSALTINTTALLLLSEQNFDILMHNLEKYQGLVETRTKNGNQPYLRFFGFKPSQKTEAVTDLIDALVRCKNIEKYPNGFEMLKKVIRKHESLLLDGQLGQLIADAGKIGLSHAQDAIQHASQIGNLLNSYK